MPHKVKLSKIKANICQVLNNLRQLKSEQTSLDSKLSSELKQTTTKLLDSLEKSLPLAATQVKIRIQERKRKRFRRLRDKQKAKKIKVTNAPRKDWASEQQLPSETGKTKIREDLFSQRRCKDANNMLQKFQLLEKLCAIRGGDKTELSKKLDPMRKVWQSVLHENTKEIPKSLENQWQEVFFGMGSQLAKSNGKKKEKLIEKRTIWDSYISQGKWGSCIPNTWVLPLEEPSSQWAKYICQ